MCTMSHFYMCVYRILGGRLKDISLYLKLISYISLYLHKILGGRLKDISLIIMPVYLYIEVQSAIGRSKSCWRRKSEALIQACRSLGPELQRFIRERSFINLVLPL